MGIIVGHRKGILNPESIATKKALEESLNFEGIETLDIKRYFSYVTHQETEELARDEAEEICKEYFADLSINEEYEIFSIRKIKPFLLES